MAQVSYANLEEEPEKKDSLQYCAICYLEKPSSIAIPNCIHLFCIDCLKDYLKHRISESKVVDIHCPGDDCSNILNRVFLEQVLDPVLFQKYDRFLLREELMSNPYVRFCPIIGCDGYDLGGTSKKKLRCNVCGHEYCFFCTEAWHGRAKCKKTVDIDFENWAEKNNVKFCPKCKRRVEKRGGCPQMSCLCGAVWCWRCGKSNQGRNHTFNCLIGRDI